MLSDLRDYLTDEYLWPLGSPRTRRETEFVCLRDVPDLTPNQFTKWMVKLVEDERNRIHRKEVQFGTQWPAYWYYQGRLDAGKFNLNYEKWEERIRLLTPYKLGFTGERYVRALFTRLQKFGRFAADGITKKNKISYESFAKSPGKKDLRFRFHDRSGEVYPILVEVKNTREFYYALRGAKHQLFARQIDLGITNGHLPVLVTSYLSDQASRLCKNVGIATYTLGRQILPMDLKENTKSLFPSVWDELFQFINPDDVFSNYAKYPNSRTDRDLEALSDPSWIEAAHAQWVKMTPWLPRIADALNAGDLDTVDAIIGAHAD